MSRPGAMRTMRAFLVREVRVSMTYPLVFAAQSLGIVITVVTTWFVAKLVDPTSVGPGGYFPFVVTALVVSAFLAAALPSLARNVREEQQRGTLEAILALGVGPVRFSLGAAAGPLVFAVPQVVVLAIVASLFGVELPDANWGLAAAALAIGVVAFVGVGLVGAASVLALRRAEALVGWLVVALTFLGGEFFPRELLPRWLEALAALSPFTWALDLVRAALLEGEGWGEAAGELAVLAALSVATVAAGVAASAWAIGFARRRGSLGLY